MVKKKNASPSGNSLFSMVKKAALLTVTVFVLSGRHSLAELDFSPFFFYSWEEESEVRALGPLFELSKGENPETDHLLTLPRPLFSKFAEPDRPASGWDVLWPLASSRTRPDGHYTYALNFLHTRKSEDASRQHQRWWLLPVLYAGQDQEGKSYFALFPVGGTISDLGLADRATFVLFPLYLRSQQGEMVQHSALWPVFSFGRSPTAEKWRIFPLYGEKREEDSIQRYFLWPLLHTVSLQSEKVKGGGFFLFPLAGSQRQTDQDGQPQQQSYTLFWPLLTYESSPERRRMHLPWPFFQYEKSTFLGETMKKHYFWPLYGRTQYGEESESRFFLWPLINHRTFQVRGAPAAVHQLRPIWRQERIVDSDSDETISLSRQFWPLFRQKKTQSEHYVNFPSLLPFASELPAIKRNYSPLWKLYQFSAEDSVNSHTLLWGLWRYTRDKKSVQHRLFPVFDYQNHEDDQATVSFLAGLIEFRARSQKTLPGIRFFQF